MRLRGGFGWEMGMGGRELAEYLVEDTGLRRLVDGKVCRYCLFSIRVLLLSDRAGSDPGDLKPSKYCRLS